VQLQLIRSSRKVENKLGCIGCIPKRRHIHACVYSNDSRTRSNSLHIPDGRMIRAISRGLNRCLDRAGNVRRLLREHVGTQFETKVELHDVSQPNQLDRSSIRDNRFEFGVEYATVNRAMPVRFIGITNEE